MIGPAITIISTTEAKDRPVICFELKVSPYGNLIYTVTGYIEKSWPHTGGLHITDMVCKDTYGDCQAALNITLFAPAYLAHQIMIFHDERKSQA